MRKITISAIQMRCYADPAQSIAAAEKHVRAAAAGGGQIILLPELFERQYFCQERRYDYYSFALPVSENPAVARMRELARELSVVLPVSFYEREGNSLYNSAAIIDADGSLLGVYRKTHIPDDHFYQEKFYFTPGNSGFRVWETKYAKIGVGICWDQWFPETARCLALGGAEILLFPTAIGSEPLLGCDSSGHWRRTMQGHSAANIMPLAAANRIGTEIVLPCGENAGQSSGLTFYGASFLTDETGGIVAADDLESLGGGECILSHTYDLDAIAQKRLEWGVFRDRRPRSYSALVE